jgi:hypothetical protein
MTHTKDETLRHRIRVHIANREHYSKGEFLDKLQEILHESEQTAAPVQEPFGWWFTPNGEFLLPTEVEVDNPRNYETYRAMYIDTPPAAPVPLTDEQRKNLWVSATIELPSQENCYYRGLVDAEAYHGITKGGAA